MPTATRALPQTRAQRVRQDTEVRILLLFLLKNDYYQITNFPELLTTIVPGYTWGTGVPSNRDFLLIEIFIATVYLSTI